MGIGQAMATALGGLNACSAQIGYISTNLANTSTAGYKKIGANFQSYVTSTSTRSASGGVTVSPVYFNTTGGQVTASDSATSFAISEGNGFVPVKVASGTNSGTASFSGTQLYYTRATDFSMDANGYLVNGAGETLMGIQETTSYQGNIPGSPSLANLTGVRVDPSVYKSIPGVASTTMKYNANFPASITAGSSVTSDIQFYDSLGGSHTLQVSYQLDATVADQWNITGATITDTSGATVTMTAGSYPQTMTFSTSGALATPTSGGYSFNISWPSTAGQATQTLSVDYSSATQYAGSSLEVRSTTDDTGQASGSFQSASIDKQGYVVFSYSNGKQLKPYRIPLVTFSNGNALNRVTGSTFSANDSEAGSPTAHWAGEGDAGKINVSSVESSNVDTGTELTQMIVAQRAYSANAKVITVSDEMIQEILGMVR